MICDVLECAVPDIPQWVGGPCVFSDFIITQIDYPCARVIHHVLEDGSEPLRAGIDFGFRNW